MKYIKQYGIQRSGTNYMRAVFEMNTDCRVLANIGGFKHGKITNKTDYSQVKTELSKEEIAKIDSMLQQGKIPKIVIIRNPYSWIPSIARYLNKKITLYFIQEQLWKYIELNTHWVENCDYIIYYEELLCCPDKILQNCSKVLRINITSDKLILPDNVMQRGGDIPAEKNISKTPFDADYILKERYMDKLTSDEIELIRQMEIKYMDFLKRPLVK